MAQGFYFLEFLKVNCCEVKQLNTHLMHPNYYVLPLCVCVCVCVCVRNAEFCSTE